MKCKKIIHEFKTNTHTTNKIKPIDARCPDQTGLVSYVSIDTSWKFSPQSDCDSDP